MLNTEPDLEKSLLCYWDKPELMKAKFCSYLEGQILWLALHSPFFYWKLIGFWSLAVVAQVPTQF